MQNYSVAEIHNQTTAVLRQAAVEPVLLTEGTEPSYVIMSAQGYQQLLDRLAVLEDAILGQQAEHALQSSRLLGSEIFVAELQCLAALEADQTQHG